MNAQSSPDPPSRGGPQGGPPNIGGVVVTDVRMPFWSMVTFMVKWALASIPAVIILSLVVAAAWSALLFVQATWRTAIVGTGYTPSQAAHPASREAEEPRRNPDVSCCQHFDVSGNPDSCVNTIQGNCVGPRWSYRPASVCPGAGATVCRPTG